jgi:predicted nucleic acid-binding protein
LIALDTNAVVHAFSGLADATTREVHLRVGGSEVRLPPAVVAELFSNPRLSPAVARTVRSIALLPIHQGYWRRAGLLRRSLREINRKANLADCLIAQSCIDHDIPLITYDRDFRHFERAGLKLA